MPSLQTRDDSEDENKQKPMPIMTRLYENLIDKMEPDRLRGKYNIMDNVADVGKMKLKEGSILEYIPKYNDLFNLGKLKVFPLQSLEEIVVDPSRYDHTTKIVAD